MPRCAIIRYGPGEGRRGIEAFEAPPLSVEPQNEELYRYLLILHHRLFGNGTGQGDLDADNINTGALEIDHSTTTNLTVGDPHTQYLNLARHLEIRGNPHQVGPSDVGNDTAQWNADRLQGVEVSTTAPAADQILVLKDGIWTPDNQAAALASTDELPEGQSNLYFDPYRFKDSSTITWVWDSVNKEMTAHVESTGSGGGAAEDTVVATGVTTTEIGSGMWEHALAWSYDGQPSGFIIFWERLDQFYPGLVATKVSSWSRTWAHFVPNGVVMSYAIVPYQDAFGTEVWGTQVSPTMWKGVVGGTMALGRTYSWLQCTPFPATGGETVFTAPISIATDPSGNPLTMPLVNGTAPFSFTSGVPGPGEWGFTAPSTITLGWPLEVTDRLWLAYAVEAL